jgi:hypothetical protein
LSGVLDVGGGRGNCAIRANASVVCWGILNFDDANGAFAPDPIDIVGANNVAALAGGPGYHDCVLRRDGRVLCWGQENLDALGNGVSTIGAWSDAAVQVVPITGAIGVATTMNGGCALLSSGSFGCWGLDEFGEHDCTRSGR